MCEQCIKQAKEYLTKFYKSNPDISRRRILGLVKKADKENIELDVDSLLALMKREFPKIKSKRKHQSIGDAMCSEVELGDETLEIEVSKMEVEVSDFFPENIQEKIKEDLSVYLPMLCKFHGVSLTVLNQLEWKFDAYTKANNHACIYSKGDRKYQVDFNITCSSWFRRYYANLGESIRSIIHHEFCHFLCFTHNKKVFKTEREINHLIKRHVKDWKNEGKAIGLFEYITPELLKLRKKVMR